MRSKLYYLTGLVFLLLWSTTGIFAQAVSPEKVVSPIGFDKLENLSEIPVNLSMQMVILMIQESKYLLQTTNAQQLPEHLVFQPVYQDKQECELP